MKQIVSFNSSTDIDLNSALNAAKSSFPNEDFNGIKTLEELEIKINTLEQTLYVEIDTDKALNIALANEKALKEVIDENVANFYCPIPPPEFTEEDLKEDLCDSPPEFPDPIDIPEGDIADLLAQLADIQKKQYGSIEDPNSTGKDDAKDILECVGKMEDITNELVKLNDREILIKRTMVNLEEFLYNYRIMESYYKKRVQTMDQILGIFDPLIIQRKDYEAQIDITTPIDAKAKTDWETAKAKLASQNGTGGSGSGSSGGSSNVAPAPKRKISAASISYAGGGVSNAPGVPPAVETQAHVNELKAYYDSVHAKLLDLQKKLEDVKDLITFNEGKISPFLNEINFEKTNDFLNKTVEEKEQARLQWLQNNLQNLFSGGSTAFGGILAFSTRTKLTEENSSGVPNQSFALTIQHTIDDPGNILIGRPKVYASNNSAMTIDPYEENVTPQGTLYTDLYNIWGDTELFFSREERGLTADSNFAAPGLKGTGGEVFKSNYIQDTSAFRDFYENFIARHRDKVTFVKLTRIEPALQLLVGDLEALAIKEVEYLFAYGKAFEVLPAESTRLSNIITNIRQSSEIYIAAVAELRNDLAFVEQAHADILTAIELKKQDYLKVPCAENVQTPPEKEPPLPGADPLGANTIQNVYPEDPDPTKFCYWLKFAAMATAVNILPIPGAGGFRYWPIGLQIPNPSGILNIPLPIIWIPVAAIVLTAGIFVIFIGQCGIYPCPFVFYIGPDGEKKFIISLRPTQDFGANASESIIKTLDKGGIAIKVPMSKMLNDIKVPDFKAILNPDAKETILDDVKDKILKSILKLNPPDITPITSKLTTGSTIQDKRNALKEIIQKQMDKVNFPTIKIPKNASKVNPKPPGPIEIVNQLVSLSKMRLPNIAIPSTEKINLKTKLISKIGEIKTPELPPINVPPIDHETASPTDKNNWAKKIKKGLKDGIAVGHLKITPKELGLVVSVTGQGMVFINPYKCKPGSKGLAVPPIPGPALIAIGALKVVSDAFIDGLTIDQLKQMTLKTGGAMTAAVLPNMLTGVLAALPNIEIPNPSKISIKDMMKDSVLKLAKMQLPSLPDPTKPPQIQIPIPGEALKTALTASLMQTLDNIPISDIDFTKLGAIDVKQLMVGFVESSFKPIETFLNPFLNIIAQFKDSKNKTFPSLLKLKPVISDHTMVTVVPKPAMDAAIVVLKGLALVPYPAVAFAPQIFKQLHPILSSDDLPPWKRLTLDNFLFVVFLDQFCVQGKKGGGILENP